MKKWVWQIAPVFSGKRDVRAPGGPDRGAVQLQGGSAGKKGMNSLLKASNHVHKIVVTII